MHLFVSDLHLGRTDDAAAERAHEAALIDCLRAHEDAVDGLYLVGDVFDQYIEYEHLVPKGFVRFQALLAEWTDRGVPVTYLVGNHDPWHRDYFEQELGVRVFMEHRTEQIGGRRVHLAHGDAQAPSSPLYRWLRPLLRHPVPVTLYRTLLPGNAGFSLARWVNRRFRGEEIRAEKVDALRAHARHLLRTTPADLVVMGHVHRPEFCRWPGGDYLNLGAWYQHRTLGRLDADGPALLRWNGARAVVIEPTQVLPSHAA